MREERRWDTSLSVPMAQGRGERARSRDRRVEPSRPLRIPRITFPWPPAPVWKALLDTPAEGPKLVWREEPEASSV